LLQFWNSECLVVLSHTPVCNKQTNKQSKSIKESLKFSIRVWRSKP
jgi:hypothetical protein